MSKIIQGGAQATPSGTFKTKKALKDAVKAKPANVYLYATSNMGPKFNGLVSELPDGVTFLVIGPDPYNSRDWYANIKRSARGGFTVS
jgi:hypothetical protein